jgi:hypothetical protein
MADAVLNVLARVPLLPLAISSGIFLIAFCVLVLLISVASILLSPIYRAVPSASAAGDDPTGGGGGTAATSIVIVQAYLPFFGSLGVVWQIPAEALSNVIATLRSINATAIFNLFLALLLFALWITLYEFNNDIFGKSMEYYVCSVRDWIYGALRIANLARLGFGMFYSIADAVFGFMWLWLGGALRVLLGCSIPNAKNVIEGVLNALKDGAAAFVLSIRTFFDEPDLLVARWDLVPTFAALFGVFPVFSQILDCGCNYLSFFWTDLFALPTSATLHLGLEAAVNSVVRFIQMVFIAIRDNESIDVEPWILELQAAVLQLADVAGEAVLVVINLFVNLVDLLPVTPLAVDARVRALKASSLPLGGLGLSVAAANPELDTIDLIAVARQPLRASGVNLSQFIGLHYLLAAAEAPWPRIISEPVAGVLSFINSTLNLPLLATRNCECFDDVAYFQLGFIFDRFNNGAFALGEVAGIFDDHLVPIIGDLGTYIFTAARIALELGRDAIFFNVYLPSPDDNFLAYTVPYCKAPLEAPQQNYAIINNLTAELAMLVGCDPDLDPYPLNSTSAICADTVWGCLTLSVPRLVHELVTLVLRFVCYLSELVQFDGTKTTFWELPMDDFWRAYIHLAECLRRLAYLLNIFELPDPANQECEYTTGPSLQLAFKRQLFCVVGNTIQTVMLLVGSAANAILYFVRTLLSDVVTPDIGVQTEIPTFREAVINLMVLFCDVGALFGSFFPFDLSCSAQSFAPITGGTTYRPLFSKTQDMVPPPAIDTAARQPLGTFCTYTRAEWATTPAIPCDCENASITAAWNDTVSPAPLLTPECFIECMAPSIFNESFNRQLTVGTGLERTFQLNGVVMTSMQAVFTTPASIRSFLNDSSLTRFMFNDTNLLDPVDGSTQPAGDFVAEILTALLNAWYQRVFNPAEELYFVNGAAPACSAFAQHGADTEWANYTLAGYDTFGALVQPYLYDQSMFNLLDFINRFMYGSAPLGSESYAAGAFLERIYQGGPSNPITGMHALGTALHTNFGWGDAAAAASNRTWNMTMDVMIEVLRLYNNAAPHCVPANAPNGENTCFQAIRIPAPAAPAPTPEVGVPNRTLATETIRNNMPYAWSELPLAPCDCTTNASIQAHYNNYVNAAQTNFYVPCMLECFGPPFPLLLGQRKDQCYVGGFCEDHVAQEISNLATLRSLMAYGDPSIGTFVRSDNVDNVIGLTDRVLRAHFAAARLNWHLSLRLFPSKYLFVRYLTDPAFDVDSCFRVGDRNFLESIAGQRVDIVVDVLEKVFFLTAAAEPYVKTPQCSSLFPEASRQFGICAALKSRLPEATITSDAYLAALMSSFLAQYNSYYGGPLPASFTFDGFNFIDSKKCFVIAASAGVLQLPETQIEWISPRYATIPIVTPSDLRPCSGISGCTEDLGCTVGQFVGNILNIVVDILNQLSKTVKTGGGSWAYGTDFFQALKSLLITAGGDVAVFVIRLLSEADCFICAVGGNVIGSDACNNGLFRTFKDIFVTLNEILTAVVSLAVDLLHFIIFFFYYLFSGKLDELGALIVWMFQSVFYNFIVPIGKAIIGFFLKVLGLCTWVKLITSEISCPSTSGYGAPKATRKRAALGIQAYFPSEHFVVPESADGHWLYQFFAPDWPALTPPATTIWPDAADPCTNRMTVLAARAPDLLTDDEADEAAYCLGQALIFDPVRRLSYYFQASPTSMTMDTCTTPMTTLRMSHRPYASLSASDQQMALSCIRDRAVVHGMKRASGGALDFFADDLLAGGMTGFVAHVLPNVEDWLKAESAVTQRARDGLYPEAVRASADYTAALDLAYGPDRAALALLPPNDTTVADYVDALLNVSSTLKKRGVLSDLQSAQRERLAGLARTLEAMRDSKYVGFTESLKMHLSPLLDTMQPPVYTYETTAESTTAAATSGQNETIETVADLNTAAGRAVDRVIGATWRIMRATMVLSGVDDVVNDTTTTTTAKKRSLVNAAAASNLTARISAVGRYGWQALGDILSGRATRRAARVATVTTVGTAQTVNETAALNTITSIPWVPTRISSRFVARRATAVATVPTTQMRRVYSMQRLSTIAAARLDSFRSVLTMLHASTDGMGTTSIRNPAVRAARVRHVIETYAAVFANRNNNNNTFMASNNTECISPSQILCDECAILDAYVGYGIRIGAQPIDFYMGTAALPYNTFADLYADYLATDEYLGNVSLVPVVVGDSAANPVRFPARNFSIWNYTGDPIPGKIWFNDLNDLLADTSALISDVFGGGLTGLIGDIVELTGATTTTRSPATTARLQQFARYFNLSASVDEVDRETGAQAQAEADYVVARRAWDALPAGQRTQARPQPPSYTMTYLARRVIMDVGVTAAHATSVVTRPVLAWAVSRIGPATTTTPRASNVVLDAFDVAKRWVLFLFYWLISCDWGGDLLGSIMRMSLLEGTLIVAALLAGISLLGAIIPGLSVISVSLSPAGMATIIAALSLVMSLSSNWALLCAPALPYVFWSRQIMHLLTHQVFVAAPILFAGMINEPTYTNDLAGQCANWQSGMWTLANPKDIGWTGLLDVPVFAFQQWAPDVLVMLRTPSLFPPGVSWIVALDWWQEQLTRFDGVNIMSSDVVYAQQWTSWLIRIFLDILLLVAIARALGLGIIGNAIRLIFAALKALALMAGYAIISGPSTVFYMAMLPARNLRLVVDHARAELARRGSDMRNSGRRGST